MVKGPVSYGTPEKGKYNYKTIGNENDFPGLRLVGTRAQTSLPLHLRNNSVRVKASREIAVPHTRNYIKKNAAKFNLLIKGKNVERPKTRDMAGTGMNGAKNFYKDGPYTNLSWY